MRYQDINHFKSLCGYEINGRWYPRVTKILDIKAKAGLERFLREMESFASAEDIKNKSAAEGSLVHHTIAELIKGSVTALPKEIEPTLIAFQKFREERGILFHPEFIERRIWSYKYRYAGTVDALATIDGKFGVLDIKTSAGFYPEYNLQTGAYVLALQEFEIKKELSLPRDIETRWILRVDQERTCKVCGSVLREKGGFSKIRIPKSDIFRREGSQVNNVSSCPEDRHEWGKAEGRAELREFPINIRDARAFIAAKFLWEWENEYWLKQVGYL